jgi:hypothetical protein
MLVALGTDSNLPVFDNDCGVVRDEYSLVEPIKGQSVIEWLDDQGYDTIIPQIKNQNYESVEPNFMTTLATFLDNPDLVPSGLIPRLDETIGSHSVDIFNKYSSKSDPKIGLRVARDYLNLSAYETYIDMGEQLDYAEINDLILKVAKYKNLGDYISMGQSREMLLYSISHGVIIDLYQMELIEKVDSKLFTKVIKAYSIPYWIKICSTDKGLVPDRMKRLIYQLNLYPEHSKDVLCHQIKTITKSDPELVKRSAIIRQVTRIRSDVAYINQFNPCDGLPNIPCNNKSLISDNLYDFPDTDIAYNRDFQDDLWCFTSNNYQKMIARLKNPYTNKEFPQYFIDKVKRKMEFISQYRDIDELPVTISDTIDQMNLPDEPNNKYTDIYNQKFQKMLVDNNITEWNIEKLNTDELEKILLDNFDISTNLVDLSRDHAEITFSVMSYQELKDFPGRSSKFFKQIEEMSINE